MLIMRKPSPKWGRVAESRGGAKLTAKRALPPSCIINIGIVIITIVINTLVINSIVIIIDMTGIVSKKVFDRIERFSE